MEKDWKRDLIFSVLFLAYCYFAAFWLPKTLLLAGGGIENEFNLTKFLFYSAPLMTLGIVLVLLKLIRYFTDDVFDSVLHDPEDSPLYNIPILGKIISNPITLILFSMIVFSGLFFLSANTQTSLLGSTAIPKYGFEQQITPTAEVGLSVEPSSTSETLELVLILVILIIALKIFKKKNSLSEVIYNIIYYLVLPFIGALSSIIYHIARYGSSETALMSVFIFWYISSLLVLVTRSVIPAIVQHQMNNLYLAIVKYLSSDLSSIIFIVLFVVMVILLIIFLAATKKKQDTIDIVK